MIVHASLAGHSVFRPETSLAGNTAPNNLYQVGVIVGLRCMDLSGEKNGGSVYILRGESASETAFTTWGKDIHLESMKYL